MIMIRNKNGRHRVLINNEFDQDIVWDGNKPKLKLSIYCKWQLSVDTRSDGHENYEANNKNGPSSF